MLARYFAACLVLAAAALAPIPAAARGELAPGRVAVLQHLPDDALGFVLVRDLATADRLLQQLAAAFRVQSPGPLALIKFATGLGAGLDDQGDLLLAFLPGDHNLPALIPVVWAPASDYAEFVAAVGGDETGEICRVALGGEDVLVARDGDFAMLMNVEHRDTMELMLAADPAAVGGLNGLEPWLADNQVSAMLMPTGVELLAGLLDKQLDGEQSRLEARYSGEENAERLAEQMWSVDVTRDLVAAARHEGTAAALGLNLQDDLSIRLGLRVPLAEDAVLQRLTDAARAEDGMTGFAAGPFAVAAAGAAAPELGPFALDFYRRIVESSPEEFGLGAMPEEDWKALVAAESQLWEGLRSWSFLMLPGGEDDPMFSQFYAVLQVDDAAQSLENIRQSYATTNALKDQFHTDVELPCTVATRTIAGKPALEIAYDVGTAMADKHVPAMSPFSKALVGDDGVARIFVLAAADDTLVAGLAPQGQVVDVMLAVGQRETGLAESPAVARTGVQLDPAAPWQALVSPQGCVAWFERVVTLFYKNIGGIVTPPDIPDFADSSPVGVAARVVEGQLAVDVVAPADAVTALSEFIADVQKMEQ